MKQKIEDAKIPETDEWSKGLNAGLKSKNNNL
jgi:hypothetical protein